ncbi:MAG: Rrf2 family transcriptional regulator [Deltaproteobacteria bacterium GWC2_42_11]|nr:MAG: Rrf2 family transcriptional regulator [Deltaproteobacteria bacterium GWC2_42_11]HBO84347.1 Rrf2 family transcriptional regulator [Deltaproteobacteria bacterium]
MRLSTRSLYGLRAIFDIAYHYDGQPVQVKDISKRQKISPRYLEQIFQRLKKTGVLKSKRGPHGGYYLAKMPKEITVGDILRATEGSLQLVFCTTAKKIKKCDLLEKCVTRSVWEETGQRITKFLDSVSIQDLCKKGELLGIEKELPHGLMYSI